MLYSRSNVAFLAKTPGCLHSNTQCMCLASYSRAFFTHIIVLFSLPFSHEKFADSPHEFEQTKISFFYFFASKFSNTMHYIHIISIKLTFYFHLIMKLVSQCNTINFLSIFNAWTSKHKDCPLLCSHNMSHFVGE